MRKLFAACPACWRGVRDCAPAQPPFTARRRRHRATRGTEAFVGQLRDAETGAAISCARIRLASLALGSSRHDADDGVQRRAGHRPSRAPNNGSTESPAARPRRRSSSLRSSARRIVGRRAARARRWRSGRPPRPRARRSNNRACSRSVMKRSASRGMCSPRSAKCSSISAANKASSGWPIVRHRRHRQPGPAGRAARGAHAGGAWSATMHQRPAAVLGLVPGVEQLLLVALLGIVEQAPADPLDEAAREQGAARSARPDQDRRLDRPQAPLAEMLERVAVGVGRR